VPSKAQKVRRRRLLTRVELSRELGCDPRTVAKWIEEGLPVHTRGRGGRASLYSLKSAREWKRQRDESSTSVGALDPHQERARRDRAQALLAEQQLRTRERELLPATEVQKAWSAEVSAVRAQALAIPTTYADRIHRAATLDGVAGVERELRAAVHGFLRELSGVHEEDPRARVA
jgi:phage terminase Nu1 subunit (DNA packaging protein)